jgi:hypothetical protein
MPYVITELGLAQKTHQVLTYAQSAASTVMMIRDPQLYSDPEVCMTACMRVRLPGRSDLRGRCSSRQVEAVCGK